MKYFFVVGEASGDLHASAVMRELKRVDPDASFAYMGGPLMRSEGGDCVLPSESLAFMGVLDVLKNYRKIRAGAHKVQEVLLAFQPDVVICVDYGGFCFRYILPFVRRNLPKAKISYYIPPKVWAWKKRRINKLRSHTDQVLTIFPFEVPYFQKHCLPQAQYVGNPTAELIQRYLAEHPEPSRNYPQRYIAILCGSRRSEVMNNLPVMLRVTTHFPDHEVVIAMAPGMERLLYEEVVKRENLEEEMDHRVHLVAGDTLGVVRGARAALVTSGTATLETALLDCPQVVCYAVRGGGLANFVFDKFFSIPYISLVNLIANSEVVREMYGGLFKENLIADSLRSLLYDGPERQNMLADYAEVAKRLKSDRPAATVVAHALFQILSR